MDEDRQRAEVFDALAHPVRISILKMLKEEALSFGDLKRKMGIESSGHLHHHLSKLGDLIRTDEHGKYYLSDQGKDALFMMKTVENATEGRRTHSSLYVSKVRTISTLAIMLLTVTSIASSFYVLSINSNRIQYVGDVVEGTPLLPSSYILGSGEILPSEILPGNTFNYTAMVYLTTNSPINYYGTRDYGTFVLPQPVVNTTYYLLGFLVFRVTLAADNESAGPCSVTFGTVIGPSGWNGEEVANPYENPPYETKLVEPYPIDFSAGTVVGRQYFIPISVFGNYTFQITNTGNFTVKARWTVWTSVVTMETRPLEDYEIFPAYTPDSAGKRVIRIRRQLTPLSSSEAALVLIMPLTVATVSVYLINRKIPNLDISNASFFHRLETENS